MHTLHNRVKSLGNFNVMILITSEDIIIRQEQESDETQLIPWTIELWHTEICNGVRGSPLILKRAL